MRRSQALSSILTIAGAVVLGLALTTLILLAVGAPPGEAFANILSGAFGALVGPDGALNLLNPRTAATLTFWVPLLLCATGLLLTFTGGLWNIGVEGQMTTGAIFASFVAIHIGAIALPTDLAVIVAVRQARAMATVDSLANKRIGVVDAAALSDINLPAAKIAAFGALDEAIEALKGRDLDAVIGPRTEVEPFAGEDTGLALSGVALTRHLPGPLLVALGLGAAMAGGALWGLLCGALKTRGRVHEIFGGVALNNIAAIFAIYLIAGPWQPPEGGSAQATPPFAAHTLLPRLPDAPLSPLALLLALGFFALVFVALRGTFWGLQLKAMGKNARSAFLLGVPVEQRALLAFALCGALAGLAGSTRALGFYNSLRPNIAGGIGFLALLVVLLSRVRAPLVPFISFFFAAILSGSTELKIKMQLDASLAGVLQGFLVLATLLALGVRGRLARRREIDADVGAGQATPAAPEIVEDRV